MEFALLELVLWKLWLCAGISQEVVSKIDPDKSRTAAKRILVEQPLPGLTIGIDLTDSGGIRTVLRSKMGNPNACVFQVNLKVMDAKI